MPYKKELQHGHNTSKKTSPTYHSWKSMKARCTNKNNNKYYLYGDSGIKFDPRWSDFRCFLSDMGERPKNTSLDRIDNKIGYCKENCRWATNKQQSRNRRPQKKNKTGISGVFMENNKWSVRLSSLRIGRYSDFFDACCARKSAEKKYWE